MAKMKKNTTAAARGNAANGYARIEQYNSDTVERIAGNYREILLALGEDPEREGLIKTPERVAKALQYLTHGKGLDPAAILRSAMFKEEYQQMVIVKDIEIYSMCEHHMLPFFGKAHVAYISNGNVIGLSKINRVVQYFSKRPQVQERLTMQIGNEIREILGTEDVAVILDAYHMCVSSRGINDTNSSTVTSFYSGKFETDEQSRNEFLKYLSLKK